MTATTTLRQVFRLALSVVFCAHLGLAQLGRGTISGTVTDQQGAAVPGAVITILNIQTNASFSSITNEPGFYTVPGLPVGDYQVTAEAQGFKRGIRSGLNLQVDQREQINFKLEVGAVIESVEVVGESPLVDTGTATFGKVIENRRVADLPINGRNAMALMILTPSVKSNAGPTNSGFVNRGASLTSVSINGGPNAMNNYTVDGAPNVTTFIGELNISPTVDSVEEFKVQTGSMSAEYGYTAGGVVNLVSRSGTNQFHGTLYEFLRNDKFDARNTFDPAKSSLRYNQYGGAVGGPVIKDRTFFFFNYEGWEYRRGSSPIGTMPTAEWRAGDFSDLRQANGRPIPLLNPATTRPNPSGPGVIRDPFPDNRIPASLFDPVSVNILTQFYPLPNRTPTDPFTNSNNFTNPGAKTTPDMQQYMAKGDHRFSSANSLSFRYTFSKYTTTSIGIFPNDICCSRFDDVRNRNAVLNDVHTFSPRLINEARVGVSRQHFVFPQNAQSVEPLGIYAVPGGWPAKLGLPASVPPDFMPALTITGVQGFGGGTSGIRASTNWSFADTVTYVRSNHTLRMGVEAQIRRGDSFQRFEASGRFFFIPNTTGNPQSPAGTGFGLASFLLGTVNNAVVSTYLGESQHGAATAFFIQDDWKVSRRLTLNLGLRYDYQQWPVERHNGLSNFNPFAIDSQSGLLGRTEYAGIDYGRSAFKPDRNDFGPRFGFAYDVLGNGSTVLRGGYGIYYPMNFYRDNMGSTAGFAATTTQYLAPGGDPNLSAFLFKDGFPTPVIQPQGAKLGPSAFLGQIVSWDQSDPKTPMSQQWTMSMQRQLPGNWLLETAYLGNHGTHFVAAQFNPDLAGAAKFGGYDFNQLDPQHYSLGLALQDRVPNPNAGKVPGALGAATITRAQSLRPYPHYDIISVRNPHLGNYISHQLTVSAQKRLSNLVVLVSYTAGKIIDDGISTPVNFSSVEQTNVNAWQNGKFDRRRERALDPTDVARRFVLSGVYELPFGEGAKLRSPNRIVNKVIGGWQINSIVTMQTGLPLIVRGANNFAADRPNSTGQSAKLPGDSRDAARWFDTGQFVNAPNFTFGNVGRALADVRTPGTINADISIVKNTALRERLRLQFRAEAFNALNHVNLSAPNATFVPGADGRNNSGTFGRITAAREARVIQLGMKLLF